MELQDLISKEKIRIIEEPSEEKLDLLYNLLDDCLTTSDQRKHKEQIWKTLLEREKSMSTGIGLGVAVPHCSTEYITDVTASLAILPSGIDFQAVDNEPVRIVVMLLLPRNKFEKHIKTLASIAKMFNDKQFRSKIISARSEQEVVSILKNSSTDG